MPNPVAVKIYGYEVTHSVAAGGAAISKGAVVAYDDMIGVAAVDIPVGGSGTVQIKGVFEFDCKAQAINVGDTVNWDHSASEVTIDATAQATDVQNVGKCLVASAAASERVVILLTPEGSITHS